MTFEEAFKLKYGVDPDTYGRDSTLYRTQVSMARWAWNESMRQKGDSGSCQVVIVMRSDKEYDVVSKRTAAVLKRGLSTVRAARRWALEREFEILYRTDVLNTDK